MKGEIPVPYEEIDPLLIPLIKELNKFPFMDTEFCCQGHPERKDDVLGFYIAFRVYQREQFMDLCRFMVDKIQYLFAQMEIYPDHSCFAWRIEGREDMKPHWNQLIMGFVDKAITTLRTWNNEV